MHISSLFNPDLSENLFFQINPGQKSEGKNKKKLYGLKMRA